VQVAPNSTTQLSRRPIIEGRGELEAWLSQALRAFRAVEQYAFGRRGRPRFKGKIITRSYASERPEVWGETRLTCTRDRRAALRGHSVRVGRTRRAVVMP
jgi:hypothetical protein